MTSNLEMMTPSANSLATMNGNQFKTGRFTKAVIAIGSTEYHGDHLPYGTDALVASYLAEEVSKNVEGLLVLPHIPYGMSMHYASFPIAVSLSTQTLMQLLREVFGSLLKHGIKKLLIINGHDGNIAAIEAATREYKSEHPDMVFAVLEAWWETAAKLVPEGNFEAWGGLGHGGEGETSMMLAVAPQLVDMARAQGVIPELPIHIQVKWRFDELTPYGVTGDPTKATREKGLLMREALVRVLVDFVKEMDSRDWKLQQ